MPHSNIYTAYTSLFQPIVEFSMSFFLYSVAVILNSCIFSCVLKAKYSLKIQSVKRDALILVSIHYLTWQLLVCVYAEFSSSVSISHFH